MKTRFYLPGFNSVDDFSDLAEAADFSRTRLMPGYTAKTVDELLSSGQFWIWSRNYDRFASALQNWPQVPLIAEKIVFHKPSLEALIDRALARIFHE